MWFSVRKAICHRGSRFSLCERRGKGCVVSVVLQHRITIAVDNGFYLLAGLTHRALVNGIRSIVVDILFAEQRVNLVACNLVCS